MLALTLKRPNTSMVLTLTGFDFVSWSHGANGCLRLEVVKELSRSDLQYFYNDDTVYDLIFTMGGDRVWAGRSEIVTITSKTLKLTGLGNFRLMNDLTHFATWSHVAYRDWIPFTETMFNFRTPDRYILDNNNRLMIGLKKGASYNALTVGAHICILPIGAQRSLAGFQARIITNVPLNWQVRPTYWIVQGDNLVLSFDQVGPVIVGTGAVLDVAAWDNRITTANALGFEILPPGAYTHSGEDSSIYARITELRLVTNAAKPVFTNLTANVSSGSNITINVGSTARMFVGQRVWLNPYGANFGEVVTVAAINSATQFVAAAVTKTYLAGEAVRAHMLTADQIVEDLYAQARAFNTGRLELVGSVLDTNTDLVHRTWWGVTSDEIVKEIALIGNGSEPYRVKIDESNTLSFTPMSEGTAQWLIYLEDLEIQKVIDDLANVTEATYSNQASIAARVTNQTGVDPLSSARYGLQRARSISVSTTSRVEALGAANAAQQDTIIAPTQATINVAQIVSPVGGSPRINSIKPGDRCSIVNLPGSASPGIERLRNFTISEVEVQINEKETRVRIIPDHPIPALEYLLIKRSLR